jgi:type 1 fimbria pilin
MKSKFHKSIFCVALLAAGGASAQVTNQGKIHMKGKIIASTCEVIVNNQPGAQDATVNMGTYGAGDFVRTGDVVGGSGMDGQVEFALSNCPEGKTKARLKMDATTVNNKSDTIQLDQGPNNAGNVGIYVYKKDNMDSPLEMGRNYDYPISSSTKTATIELVGKYVSLADKVTPGDANGNFNYTISYN